VCFLLLLLGKSSQAQVEAVIVGENIGMMNTLNTSRDYLSYIYSLAVQQRDYLYSIDFKCSQLNTISMTRLPEIRDRLTSATNYLSQILAHDVSTSSYISNMLSQIRSDVDFGNEILWWIADTQESFRSESEAWRQNLGWRDGLDYLADRLTNHVYTVSIVPPVTVQGSVSVDLGNDYWSDSHTYEEKDSLTEEIGNIGRSLAIQHRYLSAIYDEEPAGQSVSKGIVRHVLPFVSDQVSRVKTLGSFLENFSDLRSSSLHLLYVSGMSFDLSWTVVQDMICVLRAVLLFGMYFVCAVLVIKWASGVF